MNRGVVRVGCGGARGWRTALFCGCLAVGLGHLPSVAGAQENAAAAQALVDAGVALFKEGQYSLAAQNFRQALAMKDGVTDRAGVQWNIARCHEELGQRAEAIDAFQAYLDLPDAPEDHEAAKQKIADLETGWVGTLALRCEPPGARASVVGPSMVVAKCGETVSRMRPGAYTVTAQDARGDKSRARTTLAPGANVVVTFPAATAVGGQPEPFDGASEQTVAERTPTNWWAWGSVGLAAGAGVASILLMRIAQTEYDDGARVFRQAASSASDTLERQRAQKSSNDHLDTGDRHATAGYVLAGVGVAAAGAAVWLFVSGQPEATSGGTVAPVPGGAAFVWTGRW